MLLEPSFSSLSDFVAMGKHGFYVWTTYGLSVLILLGNVWFAFSARKRVIANIQRNIRREAVQLETNSVETSLVETVPTGRNSAESK